MIGHWQVKELSGSNELKIYVGTTGEMATIELIEDEKWQLLGLAKQLSLISSFNPDLIQI